MIQKRYFKNYLRSLVPLTAVVALIFLVLHLFEIFMFGDYGVNAGYYSRIEIVDPGIAFLLYLASIYALFLPVQVSQSIGCDAEHQQRSDKNSYQCHSSSR